MSLIVCVAEDRKSCEPALRLLLLSLSKYSANIEVVVFYPLADQYFLDWIRQLSFESTEVRTTPVPGAYSWNVKPQALLQLLNEGKKEVVWIDSDVLVTTDILPALGGLNSDVLVVTEEALLGQNEVDGLRARLWGFPVNREFPFPLNTGVMRVTKEHIPLLLRWKELVESSKYRQAQQQPMKWRPPHMFGDQDVLTALLSSENFDNIPVKILRRGCEIIQYYERLGFTLVDRFTWMLKGAPLFIHAQGWKPWIAESEIEPNKLRGKLEFAYRDLSPYTVLAVKMIADEPTGFTHSVSWTHPRSKISAAFRIAGFGYPPLVGLPIAALFDFERVLRFPRKIIKRLLGRYFPETLFAIRARRKAKEMRQHFRETFLARQMSMKTRIYNGSDPYVLSGPFAGMKYLNEVVWGPIEPKWLGTYEQELHPVLRQIVRTSYSSIVDVGSADGYYAVGLAMLLPAARVHSYDVDPWARSQQRRLARLNGVANLGIRKLCTGDELTNRVAGRTLIICDIEGGEYDLLRPEETPALRGCDILVELHEHRDYGFTPQTGADELTRRFSESHSIDAFAVENRSSSSVRECLPKGLAAEDIAEIMDERRSSDQIWLWLQSRST